MATLKSVQAGAGVQQKAVHAGLNSVSVVYSLAASLSVGDILQLVKVPAGAVIQDISINFQLSGSVTGSVGDALSTARYGNSMSCTLGAVVGGVTFNTTWHANNGIPYSYSAVDVISFYPSTITTGTVSGWIGVTVFYNMDNGQTLGS